MSIASAQLSSFPNPDTAASLPRKEQIERQKSGKKTAKYLWDQYMKGLSLRRPHANSWIQVKSIMAGFHYYTMAGGRWKVIPPDPDPRKIRGVWPVMKALWRWEMGRLTSNQFGVSVRPISGRGRASFWRAEIGQSMMDSWIEEESIDDIFKDELHQMLTFYGMGVIERHIDTFHKQVRLTVLPGPDVFPIPHDAKTFKEADGIMHVQWVSEQWLEQQDEIAERKARENEASPPEKKYARASNSQNLGMTINSSTLGQGGFVSRDGKGALAIRVWMKPTVLHPNGEYFFQLDKELYGYWNAPVEGVVSPIRRGKIPLEPIYYNKTPHDWWGYGFCEDLISMQLEANRQWSYLLRSARTNRSIVFYDNQAIDSKDVQTDVDQFIPFDSDMFDRAGKLIEHVPASGMNRDVAVVFEGVQRGADRAAGFESKIIFGQQEGRTEGGPATSLLAQNAQTPMEPVLRRIHGALKRMYPEVLQDLREIWPEEKQVRVGGIQGMGKQMTIKQAEIPMAEDVILSPTPMMAGGRNAMAQLLFGMRQLKGDDGNSPMLKERELRRALQMLNMNPPGLELVDEAEQRILWRIEMLINDGKQPAIPPAGAESAREQVAEDHRKAVALLKEKVLGPGFQFYGPMVQQALLAEMKFHNQRMHGAMTGPDQFDDDIEAADAARMEREMDMMEQDFDFAGQFAPEGQPLGLVG